MIHFRKIWFIPAVLLLMLASLSAAAEPLTKVELSKRGKEATALLELQPRTGYAAAFCVHSSGLFITSEQTLRQRGGADAVTLVLQPGLKTQKALIAKVVRRDAELNLALLRIEGMDRHPALSLSADDDLVELLELAAFGFLFGPDLAEGEYPTLSVKLGHVASLRRKAGDLVRLQLDTGLSAGFTGGVVLDPQGKAAGVIVAGGTVETTSIIPAGQVARFLTRPDVRFTAPAITAVNRSEPQWFEVRAESILPGARSLEVELILRGDDGKDRRHKLEGENGLYRVKAVPVPGTPGPLQMQAAITFADGAVSGAVADQPFSIAGTRLNLSSVQSVRFGPNSRVVFHDGKLLEGPLNGLGALQVLIDRQFVGLNLSEAIEARFESPSAGAVAYTVIVTREGQEVARLTGKLGEDTSAQVPIASVTGIRPPVLGQDQVVKMLPGVIADVCVGGGGRFLILHLAQQRKLAIFDVNEAQVVKYLPVAEDNIKFAAGRDRLVVVLPSAKIIQRWSLTTFEREVAAPLPYQFQLVGVAMGSASDGPLLVESVDWPRTGEFFFFDIQKMKKLDIKPGRTIPIPVAPGRRHHASSDGRCFTAFGAQGGPQSYILREGAFDPYDVPATPPLVPGQDGHTLYGAGRLFTADGKPLGEQMGGHGNRVWYLPALQGLSYLSLNETPNDPKKGRGGLKLNLHLPGNGRPLATFPDLDAIDTLADWRSGVPPFERHVFLIPDARLLVVLPMNKDRLVLHRFNFDDMLEKSGVDYLFVSSQPPAQFRSGAAWSYQPVVKSKKGGVKFKLESGPSGMELSPSGLLRWVVPANFDQREVDVVMTLSDASGQEIFHTFKLTSADGSAASPTPSAPVSSQPPAPPGNGVQGVFPEPGPRSLPIEPAPIKGDSMTITLPATVRDICAGGSGRFLILHLPQPRQLAVFDVNEARIVKYLPLAEDNVFIAAGMNHLLVAMPDKNLIQRWSLSTFEREVTAPLPNRGIVGRLCMGSASHGPLLVALAGDRGAGAGGYFLDPATLKELTWEWPKDKLGGFTPNLVRAAANGRVFGMHEGFGGEPHALKSLLLQGSQAILHGIWAAPASIGVPSPDGRFLFTAAGIFSNELKPVFPLPGTNQTQMSFLPALHGSYFMQLHPPDAKNSKGSLSFFLTPGDRPLVRLDNVEGICTENIGYGSSRDSINHDKRVHFIPDAKLVVSLPATNDRLILYRFDLDQALENSGIDYLFVTSVAPIQARRGMVWSYPLAVKSKKGGIRYKLESGPDGMKIGADGGLNWDVPESFADKEVDVIVAISDASGQEIFHTFKIAVKEKAEAPLRPVPKTPDPEPPKSLKKVPSGES